MHDARSFRRRMRHLGLASISMLLPLACAPDLKGGLTGSGGAASSSAASGGGGGGGAGGNGGASGNPETCGDGVLDPGEECDDANATPGDGCTGCLSCNGPDDSADPPTWHCYTYVTSSAKTWADARKDCQARGGDLAAISTPAEHDYLNGKTEHEMWIGGSDQAAECVFTWSNGEPWYPRWVGGEPNNFNGAEDCVTFRVDGQFNDGNCGTARAYLCERVPLGGCGDAIVQSKEECDDGNDSPGDGCDQCQVECAANEIKNPANLHCYRLVTGADKNWDGAKSACNADGGYLATITTPQETTFFKDLVKELSGALWLGMKQAGSWIWVTNEPNCWANWAPGQPSFGSTELCVEALVDGTWNNNGCDEPKPYLCERAPLGN